MARWNFSPARLVGPGWSSRGNWARPISRRSPATGGAVSPAPDCPGAC